MKAAKREVRAPAGPIVEAIALEAIEPSPHNPRIFDAGRDQGLASLAESIRSQGVIQPVVVRPVAGDGAERYQLVAGERRWRASRLAGMPTIAAVIREDLSDEQALELTVLENLQREDLSPLEEARGVASLVSTGQQLEIIADRLGKPVRWVARRAQLVQLSPAWREAVADEGSNAYGMSAAQLELIARLPESAQDWVLSENKYCVFVSSNLSEIRRLVGLAVRDLGLAPWPLEDGDLVASAPACSACPKRSACNPTLWGPEDAIGDSPARAEADRCLDASCWAAKAEKWLRRQVAATASPVLLAHEYGDKIPTGVSGQVYSPYAVKVVDGPGRGVVEAIYATGPAMGRRVWIKPPAAAAKKIAGKAEKGAAAQLAEKRSGLGDRRAKRALELAAEHVKAIATPSSSTVILLAAAFGTSHRRDSAGWLGYYDSAYTRRIADVAALMARSLAKPGPVARLWEGVRGVVVDLILSPTKNASEQWSRLGIPTLQELEPHLGYSVPVLLQRATAEIPEPKSWRKLERQAAAEAEQAAKAAAKAEEPKRGPRRIAKANRAEVMEVA